MQPDPPELEDRRWTDAEAAAIADAKDAGYRPLHPNAADPLAQSFLVRPTSDGRYLDMVFLARRGDSFARRYRYSEKAGTAQDRPVDRARGAIPAVIHTILEWTP